MPRINRIRLVNFSWSKQKIDDLMLDFHGGQNAEIRLENGGGKSVLERLIYQTVWPGTTISSNPITDYLNTKPATVAVEWLLDTGDQADYLLTGTVLVKQGASEEDNTSVKYFCFLSHDETSLNILDLPNIHADGSRLTIDSYSEAQQAFRTVRERSLETWLYSRSDAGQYRKKLKEFHISAENWDTLIRQLISGEDPFKDVLERTKTGDTLLDRYLIPKIETHLDEKEGSPSSISANLDSLVQKSADQKKMLRLRDLISSYLDEEPAMVHMFQECQSALSERDTSLRTLSSFASAVEVLNRDSEDGIAETEEKLAEADRKENRIHQEQASAQWYDTDQKLQEVQEYVSSLQKQNESLEQKINDLKHAIAIASGCRLIKETDDVKGQIRALEQQMLDFTADERQAHLQSLRYSLKLAYETRLKDINTQLETCTGKRKDSEAALAADAEEKVKANDSINKLDSEEKKLEIEIAFAEKKQKEILSDLNLGLELGRTLTGEYAREDTAAAEKILQQRQKEAKKAEDKINHRLSQLPQLIQENKEQQRHEISQKANDQQAEKEERRNYEAFLNQKELLKTFFEKNEIAEKLLYSDEKETVLSTLFNSLESQRQNTEFSITLLRQLIDSIEKGVSCIPASFASLLNKNCIEYETGEQFLKQRNDADVLFQEHPLLPYGILVDNKEWKKLQELDQSDLFLDRVIPIFRYEDLKEAEDGSESGSVLELQGKAFWNSYEKALLKEDTRQRYLDRKRKTLSVSQQKLNDLIHQSEECRQTLQTAKQFHYSSSYDADQTKKLEILRQTIQRHEETLQYLEKTENALREEEKNLSAEQITAAQNRRTAEENIKKFEKLIEDDKTYADHVNRLSEVRRQLNVLTQKLKKLESEIETLRNAIFDQKAQEYSLQSDRSRTEQDAAPYSDAKISEIIEGSLETLQSQYQKEQATLNMQEKAIQEQLDEGRRKQKELEQKLGEIDAEETELRSHVYDPLEENRLSKERDEKDQEKTSLNARINDASRKLGVAQTNKDDAEINLQKAGIIAPLDPSEIQNRFEERLAALKKEKEADLQAHKEWEALEKDSNGVLNRIHDREPLLPESKEIMEADHKHLSDQCTSLLDDVRSKRSILSKALASYSEKRDSQHSRYASEDSFFDKVFSDQENFQEDALTDDDLERYAEALRLKEQTVAQCLDRLNTDLSSYDHDRDALYRQVTLRTKNIIDALNQISKRSRVRVEGKSQPTALLRFELPEEDDHAQERLSAYMDQTIRDLTSLAQDPKRYNDLRDARMDARKLINAWLQRDHIPVKIYKFEKIAANSGFMNWDRACRSNSGGEHSLSCFIVIASLMAYIQNDNIEFEESGNESFETVICDNPFASVSSEHLVRPLIQIVNTLHIQLITFTHITSQSIANSFDVVIQLRNVRSSENQTRMTVESESVSQQVSKMEEASMFRYTEQETLF